MNKIHAIFIFLLLALGACKDKEIKYYPQGSVIATIMSSDSLYMQAKPDSFKLGGKSYMRSKFITYVYNDKYSNDLASLVFYSDKYRKYKFDIVQRSYQYISLDTIQLNPLVIDTLKVDTFRVDTVLYDTVHYGVRFYDNGSLVHYDTGYSTSQKPFITWWALP